MEIFSQPVDKNPAWLKLPLTVEFRRHIKAEAAKRGITSRKLVMDAVVKLCGPPSQELILEVRRKGGR